MNINRFIRNIKQHKIMKRKPSWTILFILGFLIGSVVTQLINPEVNRFEEFFPLSNLKCLKNLSIDSGEFLFYVIKERITFLLVIILLSSGKYGVIFMCIFSVTTGILSGTTASEACIQLGLSGSVIFIAGLFPHMIFYVPALLIIFNKKYEQCINKHYVSAQIDKSGQHTLSKKELGYQYLLVSVVVIIGILMESYVNPFVLKVLLKIFI